MPVTMLKVLFVSSGNSSNFEISPIIKAQGESLRDFGIDIQYFPVEGRGISGYLKEASRLRKYLRKNPVDIIHAHYTLSGWTAVLSFPRQPVVLSLMGDDANGTYIGPSVISFKSQYLRLLTYAIQPFVSSIISKSKNIEASVFRKKISYIIPNGVLIERFNDIIGGCRNKLGLDSGKKYILYLANKKNQRKNYQLVRNALSFINRSDVEVLAPFPVRHEQLIKYFNTADVFILSSFMEGSPNVVKEAMACNCPIVSTDVGDVKWVLGDTEGCFLASFDPVDFAEKITLALDFASETGRTNGRNRILALGLDSETIAKKIITVYRKVIN
jgi:glycosyltransferase involved in cell wall biosynthesis